MEKLDETNLSILVATFNDAVSMMHWMKQQCRNLPCECLRDGSIEFVYFDMNGTFMFGHDRFGADQPFFDTYRHCGGRILPEHLLAEIIGDVVSEMAKIYATPQFFHRFPKVIDMLRSHEIASRFEPSELSLICAVIARHECGTIDALHLEALDRIRRQYPIGVVSNLWSDKTRTLEYFSELGILDWFEVLLFSSDGHHIKPSQELFRQAHVRSTCNSNKILFIGDDEMRDIEPAKAYGFQTLKIGSENVSCADFYLPNITDMLAWTEH